LGLEGWPVSLWHADEAEVTLDPQGLEVVVQREVGGGRGRDDEVELALELLGKVFVGPGVDKVLYRRGRGRLCQD
jgi:hypothetical protein